MNLSGNGFINNVALLPTVSDFVHSVALESVVAESESDSVVFPGIVRRHVIYQHCIDYRSRSLVSS
jgi:hypothetical protein